MARDSRGQCAGAVLMVRPARFGANPETADSNRFQQAGSAPGEATPALREFDALADALARAGIEVIVAEDTADPVKPDACFPNNWVSFHDDGTVILYPMMAPSRRAERRREPVAAVERAGYRVARTIDLSPLEEQGEFLEGTGSLVLDHPARTAYACRLPRTTARALAEFSSALGYRIVAFDALGPDRRPAYHTNVLMGIGEGFAVVCAESIAAAGPRAAVLEELGRAGRDVIAIDTAEMKGFAGNLLALRSSGGQPVIALSEAARDALAPEKLRRLERHGAITAVPIPTIERLGGGSVRCMLAEVFLPRAADPS